MIAQATQEQFDLLSGYLEARHAEGGMAGMDAVDYSTMIEETPVNTRVTEYRKRTLEEDAPETLVAACLTDKLDDGLSMIYSFYDTFAADRSLGTYMILAHIEWARRLGLPHVYLGYWIKESDKMSYKARFRPLEVFLDDEWQLMVS